MGLECFLYAVAAASCLLHLNPAGCLCFDHVPRLTNAFTVQEKHLVMAITTQQRQGQTGDTIIPTPNVITDTSHYDQVYHRDGLRSVQYIRMSGKTAIKKFQFANEFFMTGLCIEEEPPSYDMDTEDEEWLNAQSRDRVSSHFILVATEFY